MSESLFIDKETLAEIKSLTPPLGGASDYLGFHTFLGIPFYVSDTPLTRDEWTPPKDPFIEFEPKDYGWLRKLGFGTTVKVRTAYLFDNGALFSNPFIF